ncbi:MAG: hypothetical protein F6K31_04645 [Symploca sp. SIO2G7]|nr:hypothetical protein [Symploca sp. SIO2G7]
MHYASKILEFGQSEQSIPILKQSNLITVACCLLPVASFHKSVFNLVQDLSNTI